MSAATRPWLAAVVGVLAAAGGLHLALGVDHGVDAQGLAFVGTGVAQLLVAVAAARSPSTAVRTAALVALLAPAGAWLASATLAGGDGLVELGLGVALLELLAAGVLWALPAGRPAAEGRRHVALVPILAVVGVFAVGVVPTGHDHDHRHAPPASAGAQPSAPSAPSAPPSIFGDLFEGHGDHTGDHGH